MYVSNFLSDLQNLLEGSTATSYRDLMMLKVIFCSALYPQIAVPDEFNTAKVALLNT